MKVLIIGLGAIARKHIRALQEIQPDAEIYAVRSSATAGEEEGITNLYSIQQAGALNIDFALVTNPTALHKKVVEELLHFQVPLFIEKPLFSELNGDDVLRQIYEKKVLTYVACNLRFLQCLAFAKDFMKDKRINEVNIYCGSYLPDWRPGTNYRESYSADKNLGGGVHIDLIHEIDYSYWLFGRPKRTHKVFRSVSSLAINAVDYANYILEYDQFSVGVVLNYYRRDPRRQMEIVCEEGTCTVNLLTNTVRWNGEVIFESALRIADTYTEQMNYFINAVSSGSIPMNSASEAYEVLQLCLKEE